MKGIVKSVNADAKLNDKWAVTALTITTDSGEDKTYNFFKKAECIEKVNRLQKGQSVDVKLVKDKSGKYWNPTDVTVVETNATIPQAATKGNYDRDAFRSKEELRRSVALEVASRIVKPGITAEDLIKLAVGFEDYLEKGLSVDAVVADVLDS